MKSNNKLPMMSKILNAKIIIIWMYFIVDDII